LVRKGIVFRRTHDLLELCELAVTHGLTVPIEHNLLARLAPYAVEFRYLGGVAPKVSLDEAHDAVAAIMTWARSQMASTKETNHESLRL
jgi:prephenate dehydratase